MTPTFVRGGGQGDAQKRILVNLIRDAGALEHALGKSVRLGGASCTGWCDTKVADSLLFITRKLATRLDLHDRRLEMRVGHNTGVGCYIQIALMRTYPVVEETEPKYCSNTGNSTTRASNRARTSMGETVSACSASATDLLEVFEKRLEVLVDDSIILLVEEGNQLEVLVGHCERGAPSNVLVQTGRSGVRKLKYHKLG